MKKLRGLKRRWQLMMTNLDQLAETIDNTDDEIFIKESFDYFDRKIARSYKIELFEKLLYILNIKQKQGEKRYYLLWYLPNDIFESTILIFNELVEVENFFKERNGNAPDSDIYRLTLSKDKIPGSYIVNSVKKEEMLLAIATLENKQYLHKEFVLLVANKKVIAMADKELSQKLIGQ